jgi:WD40 repeat protein
LGAWWDSRDAQVWDAWTGRSVLNLALPGSRLTLGFDAEAVLGVLTDKGKLTRWSLKGAKPVEGPAAFGPVSLAALAPDGKSVAIIPGPAEVSPPPGVPSLVDAKPATPGPGRAGEKDRSGRVLLLDMATGRSLHELDLVEKDPPRALRFSGDGRRLAALAPGSIITAWDLTGEPTRVKIGPLSPGIVSLALPPDGSTLVTAGPGNRAQVWDLSSGSLRASLEGHQAAVRSLAFAPDGATLVTAGADWTARLWDVRSRRLLATLATHNAPIHVVRIAADGRALATCGEDGRVLIWDATTGLVRGELPTGAEPWEEETKPRTLAFSPDGKTLATGDPGGRVRLWDVGTFRELRSLGGAGPVQGLAYAPDGGVLYAIDSLGALLAWSVASGEPQPGATWLHASGLALAVSRSGAIVAIGFTDGRIRLWDASRRQTIHSLQEAEGEINGLSFSPDGKTLASGSAGGTIRLWDTETGQARGVLYGHTAVQDLAFSPEGHRLVSAGGEGSILLWDAEQRLPSEGLLSHPQALSRLAFTPDGRTLAVGDALGQVDLWTPAGTEGRLVLQAHLGRIAALSFMPDGRTLATAADWEVKLWNAADGRERGSGLPHHGAVKALAIRPDGKVMTSAGADRTIRVWDLSSIDDPREQPALEGHDATVTCLAYSPDGLRLFSGDVDGGLRLWNPTLRRPLVAWAGHDGAVTDLAISPDGKALASAGGDGTVRLWDPVSGRSRALLKGHAGPVLAAAFSPDGRLLASCSADRTIRLWDAVEGREIQVLRGHVGTVNDVIFSPDGATLASASDDHLAIAWSVADAATAPVGSPLATPLANPSSLAARERLDQRTRQTLAILQKLEKPIAMAFPNETPLEDVLRYIKLATQGPDDSGIPIHVDPVGLQEADRTMTSPVRIDVEGIPLKNALELLLRELGLVYRVADGLLTITSSEQGDALYDGANQFQRRSADLGDPMLKRILQELEKPIAMRFPNETPLEDLLKYVRQATQWPNDNGLVFYVDPLGLTEADKTLSSPITYDQEGVPLRKSLKEILAQLGLVYVIGNGYLTITSRESAAQDQNDYRTWSRRTSKLLETHIDLRFDEPRSLGQILSAILDKTQGARHQILDIVLEEPLDEKGGLRRGPGPLQGIKITYSSSGETLRESLKAITARAGLAYEESKGVVRIFDPTRPRVRNP